MRYSVIRPFDQSPQIKANPKIFGDTVRIAVVCAPIATLSDGPPMMGCNSRYTLERGKPVPVFVRFSLLKRKTL
jgi:hypothetical protein